jgi:hypothetical protein
MNLNDWFCKLTVKPLLNQRVLVEDVQKVLIPIYTKATESAFDH